MAIHNRLIAIAAIALVVFAHGAGATQLDTEGFVIDDAGSAADVDLNDGECATARQTCTLRAAIDQANWDKVGLDAEFKLAGASPYIAGTYIIPPDSVIDGSTQPGYGTTPIVGIQQVRLGSDTKLQNVAVFQSEADPGSSGVTIAGDRVLVTGCYIGLDQEGAVGDLRQKNTFGIYVGGHDDVIGGTGEGTRNVIAGWLEGVEVVRSTGAKVEGDYIGVDPDGTTALGNNVGVSIQASSKVTIGGTTAKARNVISGSTAPANVFYGAPGSGVYIDSQSSEVTVVGNYIGTNDDGTAALPNTNGLDVESSSDVMIGGERQAGDRCSAPCNLISGNAGFGIYALPPAHKGPFGLTIWGNFVGTDLTGSKRVPNTGSGIYIGGSEGAVGSEHRATTACTSTCNLISGNGGDGIEAPNASSSSGTIYGNYVGVDRSGERPLANEHVGIRAFGSGWRIGSGDFRNGCRHGCNLVSANREGGLVVSGDAGPSGKGAIGVSGNVVGLDKEGHARSGLGNGGAGIKVVGERAWIGGFRDDGNLIADNARDGVELANADEVRIWGNWIGVDADGKPAGNKGIGVDVHGTRSDATVHVEVGGTAKTDLRDSCQGACNVISANDDGGVLIWGVGGVSIQGNYVGVDPKGRTKSPGQVFGVKISTIGQRLGGDQFQTVNNVVGGRHGGLAVGDAANLISGNKVGVEIEDDPASGGLAPDSRGNEVLGNLIGTDKSGDEAIPNVIGVYIHYAYGERIGARDAGNVISGNTATGVVVKGSSNHVQANVVGLNHSGKKKLANGDGEIGIEFGQHNVVTRNTVLAGSGAIFVLPAAGKENTISPNTEHPG